MDKKDAFKEKLSILKAEISELNKSINLVFDRIWKIRQIQFTLWIAALGIGLGVINKESQINTSILAISIIIPIWFFIIESVFSRARRQFNARNQEIQKFLNQKEYVLPSTQKSLSFDKSLAEDELLFPIYDLSGEKTFGDNNYLKWRKSILSNFTIVNPPLIYGSQLFVSVSFFCIKYQSISKLILWWIPSAIVILLVLALVVFANIKRKKLLK